MAQLAIIHQVYTYNKQFYISGSDSGLSIVNTGATKAVANVSRQNHKDRHLWSESILPERQRQMTLINRSMSAADQRKPSHNSVMSDNLIQTLDTLSLDKYVQGR